MDDIILHLLPYLDLKTVSKCRRVSKNWRTLINNNKRFWIRELQKLKNEKIYFKFSKTVPEVFDDWEDVFDHFEKEAETHKLRKFVMTLQGDNFKTAHRIK